MGGNMSRTDFEWVYTQQPHVSRRSIILKKYPEIKKLMGPDPRLKWIVSAMVIFQIISCYYIGQLSLKWILVLGYCLGGVVNHMLTLAIHDISHNVIFGNYYPFANRLFGMWANLPLGVPMSVSFKKYHIEHHRYLSTDFYDTDLPTEFEAKFFRNIPLKLIWLALQPFFYTLRPMIVRPKLPTRLEILNFALQLIFNILIVCFCGWWSLFYLASGTILAMGLHPMCAHFIAEHYMFSRGFETYSYYGPWNYITFNVGYHMEHHDFPFIPGSRLPEVKRIASEFYDNLPQHNSWLKVLWDFLMDDQMGPYTRIKREYDEVFGSRKKQNPHINDDTPATWPMGKPSEEKEKITSSVDTQLTSTGDDSCGDDKRESDASTPTEDLVHEKIE